MQRYSLRLDSALMHTVLLIAVCLPYCINLGKSSIWDANEAFCAETPREMLKTGDYLAPHFNFHPFAQNPPLTYWVILVSYKLFGVNEFAVRLPSALAAIGMLLFSYGIGRLLFSPNTGLLSAMMISTTARLFILARRFPMDILLLFFLTGTLFFLVKALRKNSKSSWALAYVCTAFGFLTKGPVALFIPACAYLLWGLRRRQRIPESHPLMGAAIFLCIVLPWYVCIYSVYGWIYISPLFLRTNLGRFAAETVGHARNLSYYFSVYAVDFFPWSILSLFAVYLLWHHRRQEPVLRSLSFGLPIIWCASTFVLFSVSKNKQEYYIAPMYPVAAVLVAGVVDRMTGSKERGDSSHEWVRSARLSLWMWMYGLPALSLLFLSSIVPYIFSSFMPAIPAVLHYAPSVLLVGGALSLVWSIRRREHVRSFLALIIPLWAIYMMCGLSYLPALESFRPVKRFCQIIEAQSNTNDEAGFFGTALPSMAFYLRRPIFEEDSSERMLRRFKSEKRVFCVLSQEDFGYFPDTKDLKVHILERRPRFSVRFGALMNAGYFPGEELLLVSNRPSSQKTAARSGPQ